jgi:hypothetical protein
VYASYVATCDMVYTTEQARVDSTDSGSSASAGSATSLTAFAPTTQAATSAAAPVAAIVRSAEGAEPRSPRRPSEAPFFHGKQAKCTPGFSRSTGFSLQLSSYQPDLTCPGRWCPTVDWLYG